VIWIAVALSVLALAVALAALQRASATASTVAEQARRTAVAEQARQDAAAGDWTSLEGSLPWRIDEPGGVPGHRDLIRAALAGADQLSGACHVVTGTLDAAGEPPTAADYGQVHRCSDRFIATMTRLLAPDQSDAARGLSSELITLHHGLVAEIRQHQQARYPFVGARDTTLANQMLHNFDTEVARLRAYLRTGVVPEPSQLQVDYETVRFIARDVPAQPSPPSAEPT
jgi:hypothetical protein